MSATAGIVSVIAGTANTAASQYNASRATTAQAAFSSKVADLNAADTIARGDFAAQQRAIAGNRTTGQERAAAASSGIDANSGSSLDVQASEAGLSALDQAQIRNNAAREAWGYKSNAQLESIAAGNEAAAQRNQAFSTLLTGGAQAYGMWETRRNTTGGVMIPKMPYNVKGVN